MKATLRGVRYTVRVYREFSVYSVLHLWCFMVFVDVVIEDMEIVGEKAVEAGERVRWGQMTHCGDP